MNRKLQCCLLVFVLYFKDQIAVNQIYLEIIALKNF